MVLGQITRALLLALLLFNIQPMYTVPATRQLIHQQFESYRLFPSLQVPHGGIAVVDDNAVLVRYGLEHFSQGDWCVQFLLFQT